MAEEENIAPESAETNAASPEGSSFLVKERFEIDYTAPLPDLDSNGAKAFVAKDKVKPERELFALICDNNFPPRLSILPYLKAIEHPSLLKLVEYSVVDYLPQKTMNMALIYERPTGPKVISALPTEKLSAEKFKSLVLSIISACESLKSYNLTHRAIRLDNLFFKDADCSELVLGDCAATFSALFQPAAYETIESMLCLPQGRGQGSSSDDIYAAGVALLGLALQHEVNPSMSTSELLHLKLKKGSLTALTTGDKLLSQYVPILRGMLEDSAENRWNSIQIFNFLDGKAPSFSNETSDRSMRALTIGGEKYYTAKSAALALLEDPENGITVVRNGKLLEWIKNGLENEKLYNKLEKIILADKENPGNRLLVPQVCVYLDYSLPIRCGDIYVFPGGLPKAVFHYLKTNQSLEAFYQVLSTDIVKIWYQEQPFIHAPSGSNEFKVYLARNDYGYGIDRIMYDFDEDLPCTSPLIGKEFVNSPSKLLRALDNNYAANRDNKPYDKNIIAYLRCKMGKKIDGLLTDLNANQDALQAGAILRLYANIQNKQGPVQLFNLTQWLMKTAQSIVQTYHNLKYRKFLEHELVKLAKNGKIIDLFEILDNDEAKKKDRADYSEALKKINILMTERNRIMSGGTKLDDEAKELAIKFGSILAILTMLSSFIFSIIYWALK